MSLTGGNDWGGFGAALGSDMAVITDSDPHVIDGALDVVASFAPGMRCIVLTSASLRQGERPAFERTLFFAESLPSHLGRFK